MPRVSARGFFLKIFLKMCWNVQKSYIFAHTKTTLNMRTIEIIANFMKGNTKVTITEKQKSWLISQAKSECLLDSKGWHDSIYFEDCFYQIKQCKTLASGGSYVATKLIQGKYNIEKLFTIKFTENSQHTAVYGLHDLKSFERDGIKFEIIPPYRNTKTK